MDNSDRVEWLLRRARNWVYVVERLEQRAGAGTPTDARIDSHMLVLALRHLDTCLRHARALDGELPPDLCGHHDLLREQIESAALKALRDALEHEEGRVSRLEMGGYEQHVYASSDPLPPSTVTSVNGQFRSVTLLGAEYVVEGAVREALQLYPSLHTVLQERYSYPDGLPSQEKIAASMESLADQEIQRPPPADS